MPRKTVQNEQDQLLKATRRYYDSLPVKHRELFAIMAADVGMPPEAIIAGALEKAILEWKLDNPPTTPGEERT